MTNFYVFAVIRYAWLSLGLIWLIALAFTKRVVRSQPGGARLFQLAVLFLGYCLLSGRWFHDGWLGVSFIPENDGVRITGMAMTVLGGLFAIWARLTLGGNWSGRVTVKEDHELIVKGPYAVTRHPIYSGILLAYAGTAFAVGKWHGLVGLCVILIGLMIKMSREERLMMETFPDAYPQYRQRVKALIPGIF
jgi:protein-S-isoprenylcysteine O-methyltransferase Ste14